MPWSPWSRGMVSSGDPGVRRQLVTMYVASTVQKLVSARISDAMADGRLPDGYGGLLKLGEDIVTQRRAEVALALSGAEGVTWGIRRHGRGRLVLSTPQLPAGVDRRRDRRDPTEQRE